MDFATDQLAGCRVLLTAHRRAAELGAALERRGAEVVHAPVLSIVPHVDDARLLARTREVLRSRPDVVVVTTGVGMRGWIEAADAEGLAPALLETLAGSRIIARGPKALGAIQAARLTPEWVAPSETTAEITERLLREGVAGLTVAVQHHGSGADGLDEALAAAGARVISLVVYRWGPPADQGAVSRGVQLVAEVAVDAVVFTSAPGAAAFMETARREGRLFDVVRACHGPEGVLAAAVGPVTAAPLRAAGIHPLVPDRWRMGSLVRELVARLGSDRRTEVPTPWGPLLVQRRRGCLDGKPLALTPTTLAVLRLLVEARGSVVTRPEIVSALPGPGATLHAAEMAVARLRDALGHRELIETVVKRGYRVRVDPAAVPYPAPPLPQADDGLA